MEQRARGHQCSINIFAVLNAASAISYWCSFSRRKPWRPKAVPVSAAPHCPALPQPARYYSAPPGCPALLLAAQSCPTLPLRCPRLPGTPPVAWHCPALLSIGRQCPELPSSARYRCTVLHCTVPHGAKLLYLVGRGVGAHDPQPMLRGVGHRDMEQMLHTAKHSAVRRSTVQHSIDRVQQSTTTAKLHCVVQYTAAQHDTV